MSWVVCKLDRPLGDPIEVVSNHGDDLAGAVGESLEWGAGYSIWWSEGDNLRRPTLRESADISRALVEL